MQSQTSEKEPEIEAESFRNSMLSLAPVAIYRHTFGGTPHNLCKTGLADGRCSKQKAYCVFSVQLQKCSQTLKLGAPMKILVSLLLILAPATCLGACDPSNFKVTLGTIEVDRSSGQTSYQIPFILANNNAEPCGAQIEMRLLDANGDLITAQTGWPASTSNIPPGDDIAEDWGAMFFGKTGGSKVSVKIRAARRW